MLQEAKDLQNSAVKQLVDYVKSNKKDIVFKAPTGSGKTYMMADLVNRLLIDPDVLKGQDASINGVVFLISSLSKGDLAKQNYEKFCEYSENKFFSNLKPYLINSEVTREERLHIPLDYNVYFIPRDLYKKKARLKEEGVMKNFLLNLTNPLHLGGQGKLIILIKDECHINTKNLDELNSYFYKVVNVSATPKLSRGQVPSVEISEMDAVNTKLIKYVDWQDDEDTIEDAINKFIDIKQQYLELLKINPCLIIQISNKDKAEQELENIYKSLKNTDLKYMLIVNNETECRTNDFFKVKKLSVSQWKDFAKNNTSTIDVIIFKMVISEGWDIPRACMLYQVRDSKSSQLDEQVLGRVRRNPRLLDFETLTSKQQDLCMQAYVWGIQSKKQKQWHSVLLRNNDIKNSIKVQTTKLKPLTEKKDFNISEFISKQPNVLHKSSIFDLGYNLRKVSNDIQKEIYSYSTDFQKWREVTEHVTALQKEYDTYICDYKKSLEIQEEQSFPVNSSYLYYSNVLDIHNNIWMRKEKNEAIFSFDSEAEKEWAKLLKEICKYGYIASLESKDLVDINNTIYLWGKNYPINSDIKFEYYRDGIHSSYPDFIMKDKKGIIHIFEVKSVNKSSDINLDDKEYKSKIDEIHKAYKYASKITKQIFYIPLLKEKKWQITRYKDGIADTLSKDQFIDTLK